MSSLFVLVRTLQASFKDSAESFHPELSSVGIVTGSFPASTAWGSYVVHPGVGIRTTGSQLN